VKLALVQTKPHKGDLAANFGALGDVFAQLAAEDRPYDLIVLPEAALTGYFLEGAVYELALPAAALAERLCALWNAQPGADRAPLDLALGFYENDAGTYYNAALYLHLEAGGYEIVHVHRKLFLPVWRVR
jgi:predicted amidohydrolase